jgi:D-alanine-D-alanine ligase
MEVLIIHDEVPAGARPDEADTLVQVREVAAALHELGHHAETMPVGLDLRGLRERLASRPPTVVFNLVESAGGTGRLIHLAPSVVEASGVAMTGCPADAVFVTSGKLLSKRVLLLAGVDTPAWATAAEIDRGHAVLGGAMIVKSVWEHASVGLDEGSVVPAGSAPNRLREVLNAARRAHGGDWFAEAFIDGREFNIALLDRGDGTPQVLPPAEIVFEGYAADKPRVVGYRAKWDEGSYEYQHTPRRFDFGAEDAGLLARLGEIAQTCWGVFGLRGHARVDFRVDSHGRAWVLEVNTNPCLSADAGFMAAAAMAGLTQRDVVGRLLAAADRSV